MIDLTDPHIVSLLERIAARLERHRAGLEATSCTPDTAQLLRGRIAECKELTKMIRMEDVIDG